MNKLGCLHQSPDWYHKRQILNKIKSERPMFLNLMSKSGKCMQEHGLSQSLDSDSVREAIQCETIHPFTLSAFTEYTFHTHPSQITYPSDMDRKTTLKKLKKDFLVIGVVPTKKIYVYHKADNFEKPIAII